MTHDEIIAAWNKQADYMNKWDRLGEDEKLEWAMKLEREACAKVIESHGPFLANGAMLAEAIRARSKR